MTVVFRMVFKAAVFLSVLFQILMNHGISTFIIISNNVRHNVKVLFNTHKCSVNFHILLFHSYF